jgi:glycine/D-amino acid oxidase-like deaminating enzyme
MRSWFTSKVVDVAIIGGGAIGCSVAYHAAARGARVTLLEAEDRFARLPQRKVGEVLKEKATWNEGFVNGLMSGTSSRLSLSRRNDG